MFRTRRGFTLIELMIAVCIIGVLASVALPSYNHYIAQARSTEVPQNLSTMYLGSVAYWNRGFAQDKGITATTAGHCILHTCCSGSAFPPLPPVPYKRFPNWSAEQVLVELGFAPTGGVYGAYAVASPAEDAGIQLGVCGVNDATLAPSGGALYRFVGVTDLDGDGKWGGYVLQVGVKNDQLYRTPAFMTLADVFGGPMCPFCAPDFAD